MNTEERIKAVMQRVEVLHEERSRKSVHLFGGLSVLSGFCLLCVMYLLAGGKPGYTGTATYCGATLLFQGVGGYVLVAVISFAAAVLFTLLCVRYREMKKHRDDIEKQKDDNSQTKE